MGVDVRMFCEVKYDSRWVPARTGDDGVPSSEYDTRNAELFAMLAGINNTGDRFGSAYRCLSLPRGLPADVSPAVALSVDLQDAMVASWLSLAEVNGFDWHGRTIRRVAAVEPRFAHLFNPEPRGFPFARWPEGEPIGRSPWGDETGDGDLYRFNRRGRARVMWVETYAQSAGSEFINEYLPRMNGRGLPVDVRIVLAFDW